MDDPEIYVIQALLKLLPQILNYLLGKYRHHQASAGLPLGKNIDDHEDLEDKGDCILHSTEYNWWILLGKEKLSC